MSILEIMKMEENPIASLNSTEKMAKAVDNTIKKVLEEISKSENNCDDLSREISYSEDQSQVSELCTALMTEKARIKDLTKELDEYIEQQKALMKAKGLLESMALKYSIVPLGSGRYALLKRGVTLGWEDDDPEFKFRMSRTLRLPSERCKLNPTKMAIIEEALCDIPNFDKSEIIGFAD